MITMNKTSIENQRIFLSSRKDLEVVGWGLENPYGVRILNPLEIIGRSLSLCNYNYTICLVPYANRGILY